MRKTVSRAVRHPLRLLAALAVLGAGTLLLAAAGGADGGPAGPRIACDGHGAYVLSGHVPAGVTDVYLSYRDGASVQTATTHGAYRLLVPAQAAHLPDQLLYGSAGAQQRVPLDGDGFPPCASRAVAAGGPPRIVLAARPSDGPPTPAQRANALDNQATMEANRTAPECKMDGHTPRAHVRYSDGAPDPAMLALLGVLRRPPTAEELATPQRHGASTLGFEAVLTIFRRYQRIVHVPGFGAIRITAAVGHQWVPPMALPPCRAKGDQILRRLLRGQPSAVRRLAWRERRSFRLGPQTRGRHPWIDVMGGGGTGGVFDAAQFRTHGLMIESWSTGTPHPPQPGQGPAPQGTASGLVPDGVASVTLRRRDGQVVGTAQVVQNAFAIPIPGTPVPLPRFVEVWRDRAGRTIRVIR